MFTITQIEENIAELMEKVGEIRAVGQAENRELNHEERKLTGDLLDRIEDLEDQKKVELRTQGTKTRLDNPTSVPVKTDPAVDPASQRSSSYATSQADKDKFTSIGEQLVAVMRAGNGDGVDPRLSNRQSRATGLNEGIGSQGGFLLQQDFTSELMRNVFDTGLLAPMCRRVPISGNSNSIKINGVDETSRATGSRWGGVTGYWPGEAGEKTASKPKFRKIELNLHKLIGLCYATDELLGDVAAMGSIISMAFQEEFGYLIDDSIINGLGAGMPLGILNSGALITQGKETGQPASTIVYENIVNMWSRLFAKSRPNAVWLISQDIEPQLHTMSLAVGTGGSPVYLPPGGASSSPYSSLYGRPVMPIEQCQTLGTLGDIYLVDLAGGYILAEKGGIQADMSIHVRFVYDESVFRFVIRLDGQPVVSQPLTPANGGATQSHFVSLEAR